MLKKSVKLLVGLVLYVVTLALLESFLSMASGLIWIAGSWIWHGGRLPFDDNGTFTVPVPHWALTLEEVLCAILAIPMAVGMTQGLFDRYYKPTSSASK